MKLKNKRCGGAAGCGCGAPAGPVNCNCPNPQPDTVYLGTTRGTCTLTGNGATLNWSGRLAFPHKVSTATAASGTQGEPSCADLLYDGVAFVDIDVSCSGAGPPSLIIKYYGCRTSTTFGQKPVELYDYAYASFAGTPALLAMTNGTPPFSCQPLLATWVTPATAAYPFPFLPGDVFTLTP